MPQLYFMGSSEIKAQFKAWAHVLIQPDFFGIFSFSLNFLGLRLTFDLCIALASILRGSGSILGSGFILGFGSRFNSF